MQKAISSAAKELLERQNGIQHSLTEKNNELEVKIDSFEYKVNEKIIDTKLCDDQLEMYILL